MEITFNQFIDIVDKKCTATSSTAYTLPKSVYEVSDFKLMIMSLMPNEVKVKITIDDIRLRSNPTTKKNNKVH